MKAGDANRYFFILLDVLSKLQLNWVVEQVNEQIRFGKLGKPEDITTYKSEQEVHLSQYALFDQERKPIRGRKEKFTVVKPYTPQEKIILLIDAIERLFIETIDIHNYVIEFLAKEKSADNIFSDVIFVAEDSDEEILSLSKIDVHARVLAVQELKPLLDKLRYQVNNNDN